MRARVTGLGLWAPGYPTVEAWRSRTPDPTATTPTGGWIHPRQRRRATDLTHLAAHALDHALAQAGRGPADVALLTASTGGELCSTFANLELLVSDPPSSSPLRFGNSVHNAALGHLAISAGNTHFASALAASRDQLVLTGLLEALAYVLDTGLDAALVFCDERWPGTTWDGLAVAVVLSRDATGGLGVLTGPTRAPGAAAAGALPADLAENPSAQALSLLDLLLSPTPGTLALTDAPWSVAWTPEAP